MSTTSIQKKIFAPGGTNDSLQAEQYTKGSLTIDQLDKDPFTQFDIWFKHANQEKVYQPETVTLSTAELPSGRVSARMVYLKEMDDKGFVIYSNWGTSRKASDVASNPHAALTFWWHELERQVRVEGPCERLTSEESQVYYDTRIRGSRLGAWASQQSKVLRDREELEQQVADVEKKFDGHEKIPVPEFWGGLRVKPEMVEFWQGRPSRLHDRFRYTKEGAEWKIERLSPYWCRPWSSYEYLHDEIKRGRVQDVCVKMCRDAYQVVPIVAENNDEAAALFEGIIRVTEKHGLRALIGLENVRAIEERAVWYREQA